MTEPTSRTTLPVTSDILALYAAALPSTRQGALYNAMSYPTKISAEAVALFIACHTKPGETVLDTFAGSGSTGLAAILCERPTDRMRETASKLGLTPIWGARNAVIYDISEIGTLSARVLSSPPEPASFRSAATAMLAEAEALLPNAYSAVDPDGLEGEILHTIWTEFVKCPVCGAQSSYADARVRWDPIHFVDAWKCSCGATHRIEDIPRLTEVVEDPFTGLKMERRMRAPWRVYGKTGKKRWSRPATPDDIRRAGSHETSTLPEGTPIVPLRWGDLYRSGYHFGMTHLHHLYTSRNLHALAICWQLASEAPSEFREALQALVLSYNASHSTLMTRVVLKKNSRDFVLTGAQSGVLYVSALPVEKNVFLGIARKVKTFSDAFEITHGTASHVRVVTGSSTQLDIADKSIQYCFTDPPFGDYIPYAEINQVNELWLGSTTDYSEEAVVSVSQKKGLPDYEVLLTRVFNEINRVIEDSAAVTIVFHSAKAEVWRVLAKSFASAGLRVQLSSVLDKTQGSFKQVSGQDSVRGDPLLMLHKASASGNIDLTPPVLGAGVAVAQPGVSDELDKSRERLYSRFVGQSLARGISITVDAKDFYQKHAVNQ